MKQSHAESSIAYYLRTYDSCRLSALNSLLFCLSGGSEWNQETGQLDNCSSEEPREKWYPPGRSLEEAKAFHDGNDAFEKEYYAVHTWRNWFDGFNVTHFHIGQVPDNVTDDWRAVCIEACEAYLAVPEGVCKMGLGFDYSSGEMRRVMEPWRSDPILKQDKPAIRTILERLVDR